MQRGTIARLIRDRGFGFIRLANGDEIFFHAAGLSEGVFDTLREGQELEFEIENDPRGRGKRAGNLRLVER